MSDYVLVAVRFDQVLERNEKGQPTKRVRHRAGDIVSGLSDSEVVRLTRAGAIRPVSEEPVEEELVTPGAPALTDPAVVVVPNTTDLADGPKGAVPPKAGLKELWVEYAVANGMTEADAEALSKADLIERFGASGE